MGCKTEEIKTPTTVHEIHSPRKDPNSLQRSETDDLSVSDFREEGRRKEQKKQGCGKKREKKKEKKKGRLIYYTSPSKSKKNLCFYQHTLSLSLSLSFFLHPSDKLTYIDIYTLSLSIHVFLYMPPPYILLPWVGLFSLSNFYLLHHRKEGTCMGERRQVWEGVKHVRGCGHWTRR